MEKNYLKMNELNLLILDDCHNVMNNEDLKGVLTLYENFVKSEHPRILGLTASIVNNNCKPMELSQLITILETKLKYSMEVKSICYIPSRKKNNINIYICFNFSILPSSP